MINSSSVVHFNTPSEFPTSDKSSVVDVAAAMTCWSSVDDVAVLESVAIPESSTVTVLTVVVLASRTSFSTSFSGG